MYKGGRAQSFFALLALCTPPGQSPGLATGQLSTKSHMGKYDREMPCVTMYTINAEPALNSRPFSFPGNA